MDKNILETFENQYKGREYEIYITWPEFTALCPKTGQPDFAVINIKLFKGFKDCHRFSYVHFIDYKNVIKQGFLRK